MEDLDYDEEEESYGIFETDSSESTEAYLHVFIFGSIYEPVLISVFDCFKAIDFLQIISN